MNIPITPTSVIGFGTANTLALRLVADDLATSCTFFWQVGKTVTDAKTKQTSFVGADNCIGNLVLSGPDYTNWSGANEALPTIIAAKLPSGLTLA